MRPVASMALVNAENRARIPRHAGILRPMQTSSRAVLAAVLLIACDGASQNAASSSTAAAKSASTAAAPASANKTAATTASSTASAAAPTASASASAAATSDCPDGARKDDDARYCITLPEKKLAVSYEGDKPSQGIREELEIAGDRLVITVGPAPAGKTVAQLKEAADKAMGPSRVDGGDLPNGYWNDRKEKDGQHIVEGVVVSKFIITCTHWVRDEKNLEAARAVCKSLKTF